MNTSNGAQTPQTPPGSGHGRHTSCSSDASTVYGSDIEKKDLESQTVRTPDRSLSRILGLSTPTSANLDNVEEEDDIELAESEDEDAADVTAADYEKSVFFLHISDNQLHKDMTNTTSS